MLAKLVYSLMVNKIIAISYIKILAMAKHLRGGANYFSPTYHFDEGLLLVQPSNCVTNCSDFPHCLGR